MYYIGLDVGGTFVKGGIIDEKGNVVYKDSIPTGVGRDYELIVKDWAEFYKELVAKVGADNCIKGVGVGIPGTIDDETGTVAYANNFGWKNIPVRQVFNKYCPDIEIHMGNDANCAALGETLYGAGNGAKNTALLTLGTGVGAGIIIEGKILLGNGSAGGELGHMSIIMDGEQCTCGRKGCIEAYASATALIRDTKRAMISNPSSKLNEVNIDEVNGKTVFDYAKLGDKVALDVVSNYQKYLAEAIVNVINIFRPTCVMIGGGVSYQGDYLLDPIRQYVKANAYGGDINPSVDILPAKLGNDAGFMGAAALLLDK